MSEQYLPIRLSTLRPEVTLGFLLLLKVNGQFIKYIYPEDSIETHRFDNLVKRKVRKVYIQVSDEAKYQNFLDRLLLDSENLTVSEKTELIAGKVADTLENIFAEPDTVYALAHTEKAANSLIQATDLSPEMLKELFQLESEEDVTIKCAICTCSTAIALARAKKLDAEQIQHIATASLLCDISLPRLNSDYQKFFTKSLEEFTPEEVKSYKEHPQRSAELLQNIPKISSMVLGIIANHEEKLSGKGFPKGTSKLTLEEKIVSLSNHYALLAAGHKIPKEQILKDMFLNDLGSYDLELMNLLKKIMVG